MCGIAGIVAVGGARPDLDALDRMTAALAHRGPDGSGRHVARDVAMVNTRLAIIDLETGDQPLYREDGSALVANGEIYNYRELRESLGIERFKTHSDCEPPLLLHGESGTDFADSLRGMYAIAIHDLPGERLILARDPFGIKPLYYCETPDAFAFASEPAALIEGGFASRELRPSAEAELAEVQFTSGTETIWRDICRVAPGETITVASGRIIDRRVRPALPDPGAPDPAYRASSDEEKALAELDRVLEESVRLHQRADVDFGMFFSGGVDSTALLAMMARLDDRPVRAFTAGFSGADAHDERGHARSLASRLGAEHIEVEFTETDFWSLLPAVVRAMDDPAADYAILPTFKLASVAARDLKVVLAGEGGDELFAGYGRYRSAMRPWFRGGRRPRSRGLLDGVGVLRETPADWRDGIRAAEVREDRRERTRLQMAQAVDCAEWLPNDLLIKLDRCLMAHGLEGRTPFVDPEVAAFAFRLPDSLKVRDGRGKWLLREWLNRQVPEADAFSKKRGFTVPVGAWIRERGAEVGDLVAREPGVERLCKPDAVRALFTSTKRRAGLASWVLLFYALWHRHHALGLPLEGDAIAALAAR